MASVVFLRAANVGGLRVFQPTSVVADLEHLGPINIGAAGTFIFQESISQAALKKEIESCLPWECEMVIIPAREIVALGDESPFPSGPSFMDLRRFVTVLSRRPRAMPRFPVHFPENGDWQVRILDVTGRFALTLWRRLGKSFIDPNYAVEKTLGVRGTTRNWNTIQRICQRLQKAGD